MFKQLSAFILLLSFGFLTFNKAFIVVDYFANTSSFAKNCENKATPKLHCNGKCQMMKKLLQEEKKDQKNPERRAEKKNEITLFSKSFFTSITYPGTKLPAMAYANPDDGRQVKIPHAIFRPPDL